LAEVVTETEAAESVREVEGLRAYLRANPSVTVARLALGMTLFIEDGRHWASSAAARALSRFLSLVGRDNARWFTTSTMDAWRPLGPNDLPVLENAMRLPAGGAPLRHLLGVQVADDPAVPLFAFRYREVDDKRFDRLGYVQMFFPPAFRPSVLAEAALAVAALGPFACGLVGPTAVWDERLPLTAFGAIFTWCKRFLGIEVVDPDAAAPVARRGLPGASWLTLIGPGLSDAAKIDGQALAARAWQGEASATVTDNGILLRTGPAPDLGDLNTLRYPAALADVAQALDPYLAPDLPSLPSDFAEPDVFESWRRRFVAPEGWA
jgi:hypothetical protein